MNANKIMKKIFSVITGIFVGVFFSIILIQNTKNDVAYGELNFFDNIVAYGDFFSWRDVFSPSSKAKDLYMLMYYKLSQAPKNNALRETAKKYGLTDDELSKVVEGTVVPLLSTVAQRYPNMTQSDLYTVMRKAQDDYAVIKEAFDIQQQLDTLTAPSEIFANNDLSDSGFDLIYDLSMIEKILFVDITPSTIGKPFDDQLKTPFLPTTEKQTLKNYVANESDTAILGVSFDKPKNVSKSGNPPPEKSEQGSTTSNQNTNATKNLGDIAIPIKVENNDTCTENHDLHAALNQYQKENPNIVGSDGQNNSQGSGGGDSGQKNNSQGGETGGSNTGAGGSGNNLEGTNSNGALKPAPADKWVQDWCSGIPGSNEGSSYSGSGSSFGDAGFDSFGDTANSLINKSAGASAGFQNKNFSAQVAICLTTKLVTKTVSSYQPGDSCVLCEVKKINQTLKETLSHSLVPNKVTGNYLESAKCKDAFKFAFNMNFVLVPSPIPMPSNDDIIYGKNIFEEWKKFVDRYQPLLLSSLKVGQITEFELNHASGGDQQKILNSIDKILAEETASAKQEIENLNNSTSAVNTKLYAQTVIKEISQMTAFFEGYKNLLDKTYNVCKAWGNAPYID